MTYISDQTHVTHISIDYCYSVLFKYYSENECVYPDEFSKSRLGETIIVTNVEQVTLFITTVAAIKDHFEPLKLYK